MDKRTKLIISVIGVCAVVIPALLLIFLAPNTKTEPQVSSDSRSIDQTSIENVVNKTQQLKPQYSPYTPATNSARSTPIVDLEPVEGSPSSE
ncbi:hypothetical protein A2165_04240 [Candidatus Curtissbacteria bacterium RBG_13_40_7]|uniref:Uncharacterized protein n=1 Tax=Candidatus Curtissbacteria bacterium RBG_13_40_7 TaxID=1797706 RepID=A0A1F5FUC8_9BACT|nr:MAG: hypothetical protein A2165_04240 [Candidatus Curtissbacteria bacterium RBG_13_40_7]